MNDLKRLRWRSRRGIREMDIMFSRFLDRHYPQLDEHGRAAFERLIDTPDLDIMDWLMGRSEASDPELKALIVTMLNDDDIPAFSGTN